MDERTARSEPGKIRTAIPNRLWSLYEV